MEPPFYNNRILLPFLSSSPTRISLRQLAVFGRSLSLDKLLRSANYVRTELPIRLAHRISRFQRLPFVVGMNPHIESIYSLYWSAFNQFRAVPPITSLEANNDFCNLLQSNLNAHLVAIPQLAIGISESENYLSTESADRFLNDTLRSRIGRRVLAEQHIALSAVFSGSRPHLPDWIGIVNTKCSALETVNKCSALAASVFADAYNILAPQVIIDGHRSATFTYIPDHIEYILFELLKNSMRATIERHAHINLSAINPSANLHADQASTTSPLDPNPNPDPLKNTSDSSHLDRMGSPLLSAHFHPAEEALARAKSSINNPSSTQPVYAASDPPHPFPTHSAPKFSSSLPPIRVTIGLADSHVMFRISDQGGGIHNSILPHIWSYAHPSKRTISPISNFSLFPKLAAKINDPSASNSSPRNHHIHLGLGLPMSKVYANYWNGKISLYTMENYGTDVYVSIAIGNQSENIPVDEPPNI